MFCGNYPEPIGITMVEAPVLGGFLRSKPKKGSSFSYYLVPIIFPMVEVCCFEEFLWLCVFKW